MVVCFDFIKSQFNFYKFHRPAAHGPTQCLLHGRQDSVAAGLSDALHRYAAKDVFKETNRQLRCTDQLVYKVFLHLALLFIC